MSVLQTFNKTLRVLYFNKTTALRFFCRIRYNSQNTHFGLVMFFLTFLFLEFGPFLAGLDVDWNISNKSSPLVGGEAILRAEAPLSSITSTPSSKTSAVTLAASPSLITSGRSSSSSS